MSDTEHRLRGALRQAAYDLQLAAAVISDATKAALIEKCADRAQLAAEAAPQFKDWRT